MKKLLFEHISLVLNAKKIKILIVRCHDEHDEIKGIIILLLLYRIYY
jgi:hypothetical protein